jgi:PII-like signaling protein
MPARPTEEFLTAPSEILQDFFSSTSGIRQRTTGEHFQFRSMLKPGLAKKVTIHLNEDTSAKQDFLYNEIFAFLFEHGIAGASLIRPEAGFGSHHRVHPAHGHAHMPVRIEFIDSPETVERLLPELCALLSDGLIEAHDTTIYKAAEVREELP